MEPAKFLDNLKSTFSYHSPQKRRFRAEMVPGLSTAIYYSRLMTLIGGSSWVAKRGGYTNEQWCRDSHSVFGIVESAGGSLHCSGLKKMARHSGPFVFISNHMSMLDTFLLPGLILPFHKVTFVIKEGLLHYPVFGWMMKAVNPITVKRQNPRKDLKKVFEEGQRLLSQNCSIIIFPQATRSVFFDTAAFNTLGVKLARKAGVPVVPMALKTDFQQNGKYIKEMGPVIPTQPVHIRFGDPMVVEGNGQSTHLAVIDFIETHLRKWHIPICSSIEMEA
jgi:1-acyl-sn-glycerol-3-phosphate acyltransferase